MRRMMTIFSVIVTMALTTVQTVFAQSLDIKGKVTDVNGEPLIGVTVFEEGTSNGNLTDVDGNYTISAQKNAILVFDYMGFRQVKQTVSGRTVINVSLEEDKTVLEEVVVVGYGTMKRSDLTGSVSSVSAQNIENFKTGNVLEALGGQVAGVNITTADGTPGSGLNIIVRGVGTVNGDSSPMYIVDGFEVDDISHISNQDIASIEILKDASASAIYGARAANGVVLLTTKTARESRATVSYNGSASFRTLSKRLDVLSPYDFVKLQSERNASNIPLYYIDGNDSEGNPYKYQSLEDYRGVSGINWQDEAFRNTWSQIHDISLSGGTKTTKYSLSYSHFDEDGIFMNSGYAKNSARFKVKQQVAKWLDLDLNVSYTNQKKHGIGTSGSVLRNILVYRPTGGLRLTDDELINSSYDTGVDNSYNNHYNPLVATTTADVMSKTHTMVANGALIFKIIKGLTFKTSGSYNLGVVRDDYFYYEGSEKAARSGGPYGQSTITLKNRWAISNVLTYDTSIAKTHKITAMLGQEYQYNGSEYLRGQAKEFDEDVLGVDKLSAGNLPSLVETSRSDKKRLSFFARGFYSYKERYMVTATIRADGSSVFAPRNRWGFFPSVSAAWTISKEPWMKGTEGWLDNLKLRLGYGIVGNDRITNYLTSDIYTVEKYGHGSGMITALSPNQLANPDLRWEGAETINAGFDISLLNGRISFTADVFQKDTKDLLMQQNLSFVSGWEAQWQNIGKIRNRGLELSFKSVNINKKNFSWSTDLNISFIKNKLVSLLDGTDYMQVRTGFDSNNKNDDYIAIVGQPLGNMFGYEFDGVYQYSDFVMSVDGTLKLKDGVVKTTDSVGNIYPGFVKFKDQPTIDTDGDGIPDKGDGKITSADRTIIGNGYPDWFGGITNTFHIYGFDLSFMLQFSYGNDVYNVTRYLTTKTKESGLNMRSEIRDRWTSYNASNSVPSVLGMNDHEIYSRFIEDGSYLRLKNLTFGYTFPSKWMSKIKVSKLRLYFSANNLFCLTRYSGYDPEVNGKSNPLMPGLDYCAYPKSTVYNFGLQITF